MPSLACVVVGVGATFTLEFDKDELAETIPEKFKTHLDPSKIALYPAKRDDKWLSADDVRALKRGKVPAGVKAIMTTCNQLDPKTPVFSLGNDFPDPDSTHVDVLVDVPENTKERLRSTFAGQITYNKLLYYHGLLWPLDLSSWLCGVAAFMLGLYIYSCDENLIRGVAAACDPMNGKLLSVGIPGVLMWVLAVLAFGLAYGKSHTERKCDEQESQLRYGTFAAV
ncbi:hypothetical protein PHYPSEUDO_005501 [Phytophthora pseudosyringae]|uniref:Uncharacterized protein n=1 Tax=Phytophthora pseudosyringae TaxID=221518 RepID=A0A8T1VKR4_9STRA|nr:hypothetical protein PHYPSEUDO_005501 [Phytophthora pseudosyringae]